MSHNAPSDTPGDAHGGHTVKDAHCSSCGTAFPPDAAWPRTCPSCAATTYRNPLPVAVALQPVTDGDTTGLLVIRRTIEPAYGTLALPGGFMEVGETWQQAVVREMREETRVAADAEQVRLADVMTDLTGRLLVFGLLPPRAIATLPPSRPTNETEGWQLLTEPAELGFPLHTRATAHWFATR
ncbi:NUDIX domain-containing protein [Streptantibioticus parmotrematis]|uniref:NUDIX domain-containing protein n=1 Tax=Streptantibioticus parmotrematis TaxID=2873249 RepID=UPI0033D55F7E